ncbi:MAG: hypothetical protein WCG91_00470 [Candidatus Shapirobacteria bacterium]
MKKLGIAKFLVMALVLGGGLIYGTQLVQKNTENRSKATASKATCTMKMNFEGTVTRVVGQGRYSCGGGVTKSENQTYLIDNLYQCGPGGVWVYSKSCGIGTKCINVNTEPKTAGCGGDTGCTNKGGTCTGGNSQKNGESCSVGGNGIPGKIETGLCLSDASFRNTCCVPKDTTGPIDSCDSTSTDANKVGNIKKEVKGYACGLNGTNIYRCMDISGKAKWIKTTFVCKSDEKCVNAVCVKNKVDTSGDASCKAVGGTCNQPLSKNNNDDCTTNGKKGYVVVGLCNQEFNDKRCCKPGLPKESSSADYKCTQKKGTCINVSSSAKEGSSCKVGTKTGKLQFNLCSGGTNRRCCVL